MDDDLFTLINVDGVGSIRILPALNSSIVSYEPPTLSSWFQKHWYIIFIICVLLLGCVAAMALSLTRWSLRIKQRHHREEKNKGDMSGLMRTMTYTVSNFRLPLKKNTQRGERDTSSSSSSGPEMLV